MHPELLQEGCFALFLGAGKGREAMLHRHIPRDDTGVGQTGPQNRWKKGTSHLRIGPGAFSPIPAEQFAWQAGIKTNRPELPASNPLSSDPCLYVLHGNPFLTHHLTHCLP